MSKAFTRESDSEPGPDPVPKRRSAAGGSNPITAAGARRFQAELEKLLICRRNAASTGADVSQLQSRIRYLKQLLGSVTVIGIPADRESIAFGASVKVRYGNCEIVMYQIVGLEESEPEQDRISWQSPLARQLMGHRAGEKIRFSAPAGEQE